MKQRGITGKQFADEANKDIGPKDGFDGYKKGGKIKKMASGGKVSSASKRADGCATKGKTKGKML
jgi:archaeosine-15-forming tRNA-guanine transglycosylase